MGLHTTQAQVHHRPGNRRGGRRRL